MLAPITKRAGRDCLLNQVRKLFILSSVTATRDMRVIGARSYNAAGGLQGSESANLRMR